MESRGGAGLKAGVNSPRILRGQHLKDWHRSSKGDIELPLPLCLGLGEMASEVTVNSPVP